MELTLGGKTFYLGTKAVEAAKQSMRYGSWQNNLYDMLASGNYRVSFDTLYSIYNNVADVKAAIRRKQSAMAKAGFRFTAKDDEGKEGDTEQSNKARMWLDRKDLTFSTLKDTFIRDIDVAGNCYLQLLKSAGNGEPLGVQPVDPRTVVVKADKYGNVDEYIQRVWGYDPVYFTPEELVHAVMDYSTRNEILGVSPIESIVWEGRTEMASQMSNYYFYENNAVPSHLLIVDENLSPDQVKQLRHEIDRNFKGTKKKWKSGVIPFVKDIKTITPTQKDMRLIETRMLTTKKIVVAFGVDSFLLGYTEKVQRGNAQMIRKEFYENTIRAYEIYFEELINTHVLPAWGLDRIKFKINPSNYEDKKEVAETTRADVIAGVITINEARAARGLEPLDNELADEPMFQGMLIDDLGEEVGELKQLVQKKMVKRNENLYNLLEDNVQML